MKTIFQTLFLLAFSFSMFAQSTQMTGQQIDASKKAGSLPVNFSVRNPNAQSIIYPPISSALGTRSGSICNCLIPLDPFFTVVPFDGSGASGGPGVPPDYRNDDWSTVSITLPFNYCYFGQTINSIYINNNGNISFSAPYSTFTANPFPDTSYSMVAPFWADVDTRGPMSGIVYYKVTSSYVIIKWEHVGYFGAHDDLLNTFQLIITDGSDPIVPVGNTAFCYGDMQWTTGDASSGVNGFGGTAATVGANLGDGINYIQFGTFDQSGYAYDGQYGIDDGVDWLDSSFFYFDLCPANVPPVALDCMTDTVHMMVGTTTQIELAFLAPEIGQNATITVTPNGLSNFTVLSNSPGSYAKFQASVTPTSADVGYQSLSISVSDNGTPAQTVTYSRVVEVELANSVSEISQQSVRIIPNPIENESSIIIEGIPLNGTVLTITDITGREVLKQNITKKSTLLSKENFESGLFIYHITDKNGINYSGKIIVN